MWGIKVADFALGNLNFWSRVTILWPCADYKDIFQGLNAHQMAEVLELLERVIDFDEEPG